MGGKNRGIARSGWILFKVDSVNNNIKKKKENG
jgi:hypothetical protein